MCIGSKVNPPNKQYIPFYAFGECLSLVYFLFFSAFQVAKQLDAIARLGPEHSSDLLLDVLSKYRKPGLL